LWAYSTLVAVSLSAISLKVNRLLFSLLKILVARKNQASLLSSTCRIWYSLLQWCA
jgi:hypothetical protein